MNVIHSILIAILASSCGTQTEQKTSTGGKKKPTVKSDEVAKDDTSKNEDNVIIVEEDNIDGGTIVPKPDNNNVPLAAEPKWRAVLLTGDNSISAFDNARETIGGLLQSAGILPEDTRHMSMSSRKINNTTVKKTSLSQLEASLQGLASTDQCFIHMTSHGSQTGFYLVNQGEMNATTLDGILTRTCGDRPTVVLISACYSGQFTASTTMRKPNRVILTAARPDRTSFGCGAEDIYTYWDSCLIEKMPHATSWKSLYSETTACVKQKESGGFTPSEPQFFIGDRVSALPYIL